ncbi:hypothetical protein LU673_27655 [Pseudomonas alloputida]|nr:hypothetical protein [Pseudomonas alloputida]MCE0869274.1 hypothetical protein [Pseudomonas alloputida]MCE0923752.1 hypothetical protein [Pseudomonas alloputida]MCE1050061.1 hypothetical protein [Pseudomonas alloputida]MCE1147893.1 hypothetical protein [Pseudomonas alloputida]MDM3878614.1 hypothetical protein [Pseudomonas alloputida]
MRTVAIDGTLLEAMLGCFCLAEPPLLPTTCRLLAAVARRGARFSA